MAKKASTKRVHQIAKELGVTSKDVVSKCEMEGIPSVTNHMSTLSVGLAATIRDWFNEAGDAKVGTSVQTAAPVDVTKARAKAKKKVRKKPDAVEVVESVESEQPSASVESGVTPAPAETAVGAPESVAEVVPTAPPTPADTLTPPAPEAPAEPSAAESPATELIEDSWDSSVLTKPYQHCHVLRVQGPITMAFHYDPIGIGKYRDTLAPALSHRDPF